MNDNLIKEQIAKYLDTHPYLALATVSAQGAPQAHTVAYASDGCSVYFATRGDTRKATNLANDSRVAYCIDEAYQDFMEIKGVQMEGRASVMSDPEEVSHAAVLFGQKFGPGVGFPPTPDHVCVKVEPMAAYFLDYSKGFGHKDLVEF
jgi:uncharacterized protein